jgi:hypothetical protein
MCASVDIRDQRLRETITILRSCPRFTFDPDHVGVANCLAAHPTADHQRAARWAAMRGADPNWRTVDGARALWMGFDALERGRAIESPYPNANPVPSRAHQGLTRATAAGWGSKYDQACGLTS